jgi:general secretion pathway protein E/type IV pilus assembly protein PilB
MGVGTILIERGLLTREQLDQAVSDHRSTGERLDRTIVRLGMVGKREILDVIGEQLAMPVVDISVLDVDDEVLGSLPAKVVFKQQCVPIERRDGMLVVATSDPFEMTALDELRLIAGCPIELVLAEEEELRQFIRTHYGVGGDTLHDMAGQTPDGVKVEGEADEIEQAQEASVIKLVNDLLAEAINERATDIHIEPYEGQLEVRYRIDGVLQRANIPPTINRFGAAIVSRLKIMASLNIAEKRRPQDGRVTFKFKPQGQPPQDFDLRMSVIPMLFGEGVVLRVLSKTAVLMGLEQLGMPLGVQNKWDALINRPHGILLVTGPTGSGKSTTLYASLNRIVSEEVKVITVEDPVEYHVPGVNQIQVSHKVGLDFSAGLRAILRHDPDVVMIGEIRDRETAETAVQASLTGHLVFSTLHTNDASGAATRLLDMGVEPFLIASSVEGVMAQRLVRRVCDQCAEQFVPEPADLPHDFRLGAGETMRRGAGCRHCRNTGYRGRVGLYELLHLTEPTRELVMRRANAAELTSVAMQEGELMLLKEDGYAKARAGHTTIAEVASALVI